MATRLPPPWQPRYERRARRRTDRWGFVLVALAVLCAIQFIGDPGISLQWVTLFMTRPTPTHPGHTAPLFANSQQTR